MWVVSPLLSRANLFMACKERYNLCMIVHRWIVYRELAQPKLLIELTGQS